MLLAGVGCPHRGHGGCPVAGRSPSPVLARKPVLLIATMLVLFLPSSRRGKPAPDVLPRRRPRVSADLPRWPIPLAAFIRDAWARGRCCSGCWSLDLRHRAFYAGSGSDARRLAPPSARRRASEGPIAGSSRGWPPRNHRRPPSDFARERSALGRRARRWGPRIAANLFESLLKRTRTSTTARRSFPATAGSRPDRRACCSSSGYYPHLSAADMTPVPRRSGGSRSSGRPAPSAVAPS